jgi:deoxyadenosine/deoxycytidine kinase
MLVVLSGNTCAGKSTLGKLLLNNLNDRQLDVLYINEQDLHSPSLRMMFLEPINHAFLVQCEFLLRRTTTVLEAIKKHQYVIIERYITDDMLFENLWYDNGAISNSQNSIYQQLWSQCFKKLPKPNLTVYLHVNPDLAIERLRKREVKRAVNREVPEDFISQYVTKLNDYYKQYLHSKKISPELTFDMSSSDAKSIVEAIVSKF